MKSKTEPKETYALTEKQFTQFAKAIVSVPKEKVDKHLAKNHQAKNKKKST